MVLKLLVFVQIKPRFPVSIKSRERLLVAILSAIQVAHILDFVVLMPLGPVLMEGLKIDASQFALLVGSYNLSAGLAGFLLGPYFQRFSRRRVLLSGLTAFFVTTSGCVFSGSFSSLILFRCLSGFFGGALNSLVFTIATEEIPFERRGRALGVIMSAFSIASVLGVPSALWIADYWGWKGSFSMVLILVALVFLVTFLKIPYLRSGEDKDILNPIQSAKALFSISDYRLTYAFIFSLTFSMFLVIPFLSPYAVGNIGIATSDLKFMYLVGGAFTVVTARSIGVLTDKFGARNTYLVVAILAMIPVLVYTRIGPLELGSFVLMGTCFMTLVSGRMIPAMTLATSMARDHDRPKMIGLTNSIRSLGSALSSLCGGFLIVTLPSGRLQGFDQVGILSVGLSFGSLILAIVLHRRLVRFKVSQVVKTP